MGILKTNGYRRPETRPIHYGERRGEQGSRRVPPLAHRPHYAPDLARGQLSTALILWGAISRVWEGGGLRDGAARWARPRRPFTPLPHAHPSPVLVVGRRGLYSVLYPMRYVLSRAGRVAVTMSHGGHLAWMHGQWHFFGCLRRGVYPICGTTRLFGYIPVMGARGLFTDARVQFNRPT